MWDHNLKIAFNHYYKPSVSSEGLYLLISEKFGIMSISVENKIALITGANRGIGKAITESFLDHGAKKVYLAVRDTTSTKDLEETYRKRVVTLKAAI